jgi:hypothetical protein
MHSAAPIPAIVGGTVAVADKRAFTQPGSGFLRVNQLVVLVTSAGAHNNFIVTVEGSHDGQTWFNVLNSALSTSLNTAISNLGLALTKAQALAGVVLVFDLALSQVRLGLAGDGAAGGAGTIQFRSTR